MKKILVNCDKCLKDISHLPHISIGSPSDDFFFNDDIRGSFKKNWTELNYCCEEHFIEDFFGRKLTEEKVVSIKDIRISNDTKKEWNLKIDKFIKAFDKTGFSDKEYLSILPDGKGILVAHFGNDMLCMEIGKKWDLKTF